MSNDNEAGFFITYSGADVAWAKWINWHLRKEGFFTIMQRYDFNAGSNFINEMYEASKDYSILVVLPSQHSDSPLCVNQWDAAFKKQYYERERELILVRTNACKVEGTRGPLTCIDLVGLDRIEAATRLLEGVRETEYPIEKSSCSVTLTTPSPGFPSVFPDIWNIPHRRNCHFTGRDEIIEQLHESLSSSGSVALTQAIGGLGGVGKTQLALEYAYRYKSDYSCIWWIRSENRTVLAIDYTGLAVKLKLPEANAQVQEEVIDAVKYALCQRDKWLLIFDNATIPDSLHHLMPQGEHQKILITSRKRNWESLAEPFDIAGMSRNESLRYIKKMTSRADEESMNALADAVGDLPLAIEQATAYIDATGTSLSEYVKLFALRKEEMLARSNLQRYDFIEQNAPVATTCTMSFEKVAEGCTEATDFLNLCAFFAPDDIPLDDIVKGARYLPEPLEATVSDKLKLDDVMEALRQYSLVILEDNVLSVHRLVQNVTYSQLDSQARRTWAEAALDIISQAYPLDSDDVKTWYDCERLIPHTIAVTNHAQTYKISNSSLSRLLNQYSIYHMARASYEEAEVLMKRALYIDETLLGKYHPNVAIRLNNLAGLLQATNRLQEAEPLMERVVELFESAYGKDHPNVATSINNLALLFQATNRRQEAEPLMKRALRIFETSLGPDHPNTEKLSFRLQKLVNERYKT